MEFLFDSTHGRASLRYDGAEWKLMASLHDLYNKLRTRTDGFATLAMKAQRSIKQQRANSSRWLPASYLALAMTAQRSKKEGVLVAAKPQPIPPPPSVRRSSWRGADPRRRRGHLPKIRNWFARRRRGHLFEIKEFRFLKGRPGTGQILIAPA